MRGTLMQRFSTMGTWVGTLGVALVVIGCGGRKSSLLLERQAIGPLEEERGIAAQVEWQLEPATQRQTQSGVELDVGYASPSYLREFFSNKAIFGPYAGLNPFFQEQVVFYVKIINRSGRKIRINPEEFVMLDDRGNQYLSLGPDYATALAESKAPVSTMTRGVLDEARPGYFGFSLPVGKIFGKSQQRFAVLKMATLQPGFLHSSAIYDGFIAFWSPHREAKQLKFLLASIKTDFDPKEFPQTSLEFVFEFAATRNHVPHARANP